MSGKRRTDEGPGPVQPYENLIINVALTGMVPTKKDNPAIPMTRNEIVLDALECIDAGASMVHVHARDDQGRPSSDPERFGGIIEALRKESPDVIICATTSGRANPDLFARAAVLDLGGAARPDMASLTLSSLNFPSQASINPPESIIALAKRMRLRGIVPELEVFDSGMINAIRFLHRKGLIHPPFYCNLLLGSLFCAQATVEELAHLVSLLPEGTLWAGAGVGAAQLRMNAAAIIMGGHVRVGLEDNLWYDEDRTRPATNTMLVRRIARIAAEMGRKVASPAEARAMLLGVRS